MAGKTIFVRVTGRRDQQDDGGLQAHLSSLLASDPGFFGNTTLEGRPSITLAPSPFDDRSDQAIARFKTPLPPALLAQRLQDASKLRGRRYEFRTEFHGFNVLHADPNAQVDVIAVSGLASGVGSWRSPDDQDIWLRDYLPWDLSVSKRVLLYCYSSGLQASASKQTIREIGETFLDSLITLRSRSSATNPASIVFLGHSLGGLVIKEALVAALKRARVSAGGDAVTCEQLLSSCRGMLFFGVPHGGLRDAGVLQSMVRGQPNQELIQSLVWGPNGEPSGYLRMISRDFAEHFWNRGEQVVSFYELRETPALQEQADGTYAKGDMKINMVTRESATNTGLTSAAEQDNHAIDADHSNLVKFSEHDAVYHLVVERINRLVSRPTPGNEAMLRSSPKLKDASQKLDDFVRILSSLDTRTFQPDPSLYVQGTCQWLFETTEFQQWARDETSGAGEDDRPNLFISGNPGCGKSFLIKAAMDRSLACADRITLGFFFDDTDLGRLSAGPSPGAREPGPDQRVTMCGALLSQLLKQLRHTPSLLATMQGLGVLADSGSLERASKSQGILEEALRLALQHTGGKPVFIYLDAMEACYATASSTSNSATATVAEMLCGLKRVGSAMVRICFSARPFEQRPAEGAALHHKAIKLDVGEHNQADMARVLEHRLYRVQNPKTREKVIRRIQDRAGSLFIWARLALNHINNLRPDTHDGLMKAVEQIPDDLASAYELILRGPSEAYPAGSAIADPTRKILQLVAYSVKLLTVEEVIFMVSPNASTELSRDDRDELVISWSRGLLQIGAEDHGRVCRFIHETAKSFMRDRGGLRMLLPLDLQGQAVDAEAQTHHAIFLLCMEAIESLQARDDDRCRELTRYASKFWLVHARHGDKVIESESGCHALVLDCEEADEMELVEGLMDRLFEATWVLNENKVLQKGDSYTWAHMEDVKKHLLAIMAFTGCSQLVKYHLKSCDCWNTEPALIAHSFSLAARGGSADTMQILTDEGGLKRADFLEALAESPDSISPLFSACFFNASSHVIQLLLDMGSDMLYHEMQGPLLFDTALHAAVATGRTRIVEMLLDQAGRPVEEVLTYKASERGLNIVQMAVRRSHPMILEELLRRARDRAAAVVGADMADPRNPSRRLTTLHFAELLLRRERHFNGIDDPDDLELLMGGPPPLPKGPGRNAVIAVHRNPDKVRRWKRDRKAIVRILQKALRE